MKTQTKNDIINIYNKRANRYDLSTTLFYNLIGVRINYQRKIAVEALQLKSGDTIVEIGCGTGGNFPFLQKAIGRKGKIIGIDLTTAMLAKARERVKQNGWNNVELIQCDAITYKFPEHVDAILSTFAITLSPNFDQIILNGARALSTGRKFVIMDFKAPENWLSNFNKILVLLIRPYGGALEMADRHPWESLKKYLSNVKVKKIWFDMVYIAEAKKTLSI